jgi:hypothetical protein
MRSYIIILKFISAMTRRVRIFRKELVMAKSLLTQEVLIVLL